MHYGSVQHDIETLNYTFSPELGSERANGRNRARERGKLGGASERERCEKTSERATVRPDSLLFGTIAKWVNNMHSQLMHGTTQYAISYQESRKGAREVRWEVSHMSPSLRFTHGQHGRRRRLRKTLAVTGEVFETRNRWVESPDEKRGNLW